MDTTVCAACRLVNRENLNIKFCCFFFFNSRANFSNSFGGLLAVRENCHIFIFRDAQIYIFVRVDGKFVLIFYFQSFICEGRLLNRLC
jgi:hypothetical protein